jgi:regulator of ribonuclease activity A
VLSVTNPYWLLWWGALGLGMAGQALDSLGLAGLVVFFIGHIAADYVWYSGVSFAVAAGRRVLPPVFRDFGARRVFCGPVVTVKCFEDNTLVKAAVESAGFQETAAGRIGKVLVVDGAGSLRRALLGGNLGAAAARNGWAGVVIDGCVRDVAELAAHDVGIRALASMPLPTERKNQGLQDLAVQIQGVWVHPGDWLYADADGIVVSATRLL